jgi:uncharacterized protein (DUF2141 family)
MCVGRCLVTVATLLLPVVGGAQIPPQPPPLGPGTGLIVGQVIDATSGKGLGGAVVALAGARRVMTTTDGRFVLRNVPQGSHNLTATKSGYIDGAFGTRRPGGPTMDLTMAEGERRGDIVIRLWRHGTISGTVTDEMGEPLIGIQVASVRRTDAAGRRRFIPGLVGTTDDRGMYRLTRLTPGDYVVAIVSAQVTLPAAAAQQFQEGMMTSGPDLSRNTILQVMAQSGAMPAIAGGPDSREVGDNVQTMSRNAPTPPPIGGTRLFVYPTHFYPSARSISSATIVTVASAQERTGIDLQVKPVPTAKVSGTVAGLSGPSGVVAVRLIATGSEDLGRFGDGASTVTGADGSFTFAAVPAGDYTLRIVQTPRSQSPPATVTTLQVGGGMMMSAVAAPEPAPVPTEPTLWASMPLAVGDTDLNGVNVLLRQGLRITGRVEFDGAAERPTPEQMSRMLVVVEPVDGQLDRMSSPPGRVDARGQFNTFGVPAGKYFVRVPGAPTGWFLKGAFLGDRDLSDSPLELESADVSDVVLSFTDRPASISGTVELSSQIARDGVAVIVFPADSKAWLESGINPRRLRRVATSDSGTYQVQSLPAGVYYVAAVREAAASDWLDPKFLESLATGAAHVQIGDGEKIAQNLRLQEVR